MKQGKKKPEEKKTVRTVHHRNGLYSGQKRMFELFNSFQTVAQVEKTRRLVLEPRTQNRVQELTQLVRDTFHNRPDVIYWSRRRVKSTAMIGGPAYEDLVMKVKFAKSSQEAYDEAKVALCK